MWTFSNEKKTRPSRTTCLADKNKSSSQKVESDLDRASVPKRKLWKNTVKKQLN